VPALKRAKYDKDTKVRLAAALALQQILTPPEKVANALKLGGTRTIKCKSSWHNMSQEYKVTGAVNLSGVEVLKFVGKKKEDGKHALPDTLVASLGQRIFKAARFTQIDEQLAKWLGSGRRGDKLMAEGKLTVTDGGRPPDQVMRRTLTLSGTIALVESHSLSSRYGPNAFEAKWALVVKGKMIVNETTGRITRAAVRLSGKIQGRYFNNGMAESYTEDVVINLIITQPVRAASERR